MSEESPWIHTATTRPVSDAAVAAAADDTPASPADVDAWTRHLQQAVDRRIGPHYLPAAGAEGGLSNALITDDRVFSTVPDGVWTALASVTELSEAKLRICRSAHGRAIRTEIDEDHESIQRKLLRRIRTGEAPLVVARASHHDHVDALRDDGLQTEEACKAASFCENLDDDDIGIIFKRDTPSTRSVSWGINDTNYKAIFRNKVSDDLRRRFVLIKKNRRRYASRLGLEDDGGGSEST